MARALLRAVQMRFTPRSAILSLSLAACLFPRALRAQDERDSATRYQPEALPPPPPPPPGVLLAPSVPPPPQGREAVPALGVARRRWYGDELLISDAASLSVMALGFALGRNDNAAAIGTLGFVGYAFAPPLIHGVAHRRWGIASASASLRLFVPLVGLVIGGQARPCSDADGLEACDRNGAALGFLAGAALSTAIDATLFAWSKPTRDADEAREAVHFGLLPLLSADGKRGELRAYWAF